MNTDNSLDTSQIPPWAGERQGISVIMPVHEHTPYLAPAILSMLEQTHAALELLVVVNGPHEVLTQRLQTDFQHDARVRILYTPIPGLPFALNLGLSAARHELVARMDSDDISHPDRLQLQHDFLMHHPEVTVLGTDFSVIDEQGHTLRESSRQGLGNRAIRRTLPLRNLLCHPSIVFRREAVIRAGGFSLGACSEDYDLWLRLRRRPDTQFHVLPLALLAYRRHSSQATAGSSNLPIFAYDFTLKLRELLLTREWIYLPGLAFSCIDLLYKHLVRWRSILFAKASSFSD